MTSVFGMGVARMGLQAKVDLRAPLDQRDPWLVKTTRTVTTERTPGKHDELSHRMRVCMVWVSII